MKIKDPLKVRQMMADKGAIKYRDVASTLEMSSRTVSKILGGKTISYVTAHKVAEFLGTEVADIADPVVS